MARSGLVAAAAAVMLAVGCSSSPPESAPAVAPPMHDHHPDLPPAPTTVPVERAVQVAQEALQAYGTPAPYPQWWARLAPYLSDAAQFAYAETDPEVVPVRQLLGAPQLLPQVSEWLADVAVDTNAGRYTVHLSRADDGTWQVERFRPPA